VQITGQPGSNLAGRPRFARFFSVLAWLGVCREIRVSQEKHHLLVSMFR
jgi:hypothetical protein